MWVSREGRFCFIHIQKTAGKSVRLLLKAHLPDFGRLGGTHDTAAQGRRALGRAAYDECLSAAFVRNPWDRLVSWYSMIAQSDRDLLLHQYVRENSHDFPSFVHNCTRTVRDYDGTKSLCRNQIDYLVDWRGRLIVDFVGRFEAIEADAGLLFRRLGLEGVRLPRVNPSEHQHYSAYYTDELAAVVAHRYRRDVEAFGYRFERIERPVARLISNRTQA
jgi:hypothetical protein